uniref:DUF4770 domain-containing protein n=1 Tax=Clastoptera arizonana TaxID=38151 RepID=A0A1B6DTW2_9HEMI
MVKNFPKRMYVDGKLNNCLPKPNSKGLTTIHGEISAGIFTPYVTLIVREIKKNKEIIEKIQNVPFNETTLSSDTQLRTKVSAAKEEIFKKLLFEKRKCSKIGFNFMKESPTDTNNLVYSRELENALKTRQNWNLLQKKIVRDQKKQMVIGPGPLWYQEPSDKQIALVTQLRDILKADYEEGIISRTKKFLSDLGVIPNISSQSILNGMEKSSLDPINFLLEMHAAILKRQIKDLQDTKCYSVNQRILLSAVCTLHLPTVLTLLHFMLPIPMENEKQLDIEITGNCLDEEVKYCCPYLEPRLCRGIIEFENLMKKQLEGMTNSDRESEQNPIYHNVMQSLSDDHKFQFNTTHRFSVMINNPLVFTFLYLCAMNNTSTSTNESLITKEETSKISTLSTNYIKTENLTGIPKNEDQIKIETNMDKEPTISQSQSISVSLSQEETEKAHQSKLVQSSIDLWESEVNNLLNSIEKIPIQKRLQYTLQVLAKTGDPLAQLPDCHKLLSVKRWYELRRGIRKKTDTKGE